MLPMILKIISSISVELKITPVIKVRKNSSIKKNINCIPQKTICIRTAIKDKTMEEKTWIWI